jgi:hypothetical protein
MAGKSLTYLINTLFKDNLAYKGGSLFIDGYYIVNSYSTIFIGNLDTFIKDNIFGMGLYAIIGYSGKIFKDGEDIINTLFNSVYIKYLLDILPKGTQIGIGIFYATLGLVLITIGVAMISAAIVFLCFFPVTGALGVMLIGFGVMLIDMGLTLIAGIITSGVTGKMDHKYTVDGKLNTWAQIVYEAFCLEAMITVLILIIVLSIVLGGEFVDFVIGPIAEHVSNGISNVLASLASTIVVGGSTIGTVFLIEYLFELVPEFKKFNERNPLVLPIISLVIVVCGIGYVFFEAWRAGLDAATLIGKIGSVVLQHMGDIITLIVLGAKAGVSTSGSNNNYNPKTPNLPGYQNNSDVNSSNLFFKGLSFNS